MPARALPTSLDSPSPAQTRLQRPLQTQALCIERQWRSGQVCVFLLLKFQEYCLLLSCASTNPCAQPLRHACPFAVSSPSASLWPLPFDGTGVPPSKPQHPNPCLRAFSGYRNSPCPHMQGKPEGPGAWISSQPKTGWVKKNCKLLAFSLTLG